jgi:phage gp45-like
MISQAIKTYLARLTRKLILRGRADVGFFSAEGYQQAPDEPQQQISAQRYQHYGLTTEPPDGAEIIVVAVNGGASNRASIAEHTQDEPRMDAGEVTLWSKFGQRILLDKNQEIHVTNGNGGTVDAAGAVVTLGQDAAVARDLTVGRDFRTGHELGSGDGSLSVAPGPSATGCIATGDDTSFELQFDVPNMATLAAGTSIATVYFARAFASAPRAVVSANSGGWPAGVAFAYSASTTDVTITYMGMNPITGPSAGLTLTVFVRGKG